MTPVAPAAAVMAAVESHEKRAAVLAPARCSALAVRDGACEGQCAGSEERKRDVLDLQCMSNETIPFHKRHPVRLSFALQPGDHAI